MRDETILVRGGLIRSNFDETAEALFLTSGYVYSSAEEAEASFEGETEHYTSAEWRAPEVVATYLRTLEDGGAAYATITRRLTSIHKLVEVAAIAAGDLDYEDPTKHPRVGVTLQAIRRRLSTDQDQANPLTSQRLLQVLLSIDTATVAGIRDVALLLVGWYGALRRSELAGLRRDHLSLDRDGLVLQLLPFALRSHW